MSFPNWQLHRGFWKEGVRENTLEAFQLAKKMGCEMVELDTQLSSDGVFHVFHDFSLKNLFKVDKNLRRIKSSDLQALNIPTLQEVLESDDVPRCLNIEVKSKSWFGFFTANRLLGLLLRCRGNKKVLVSSFNPMVLLGLRVLAPTLVRAYIVSDPAWLASFWFGLCLKLINPDYLNVDQALLDDKDSRERVIAFGKKVMVWTVNDYEKAERYLTRGAKSVISDLPPSLN